MLDNTHEYRVVTDPEEAGRKIHKEAKQFSGLSDPVFCGQCHDVTLFNGFRLEEAYSEYRTSPAAARGGAGRALLAQLRPQPHTMRRGASEEGL